jgi:hypothetical protein
VLEHPAYSHAWAAFDLPRPSAGAGWQSTLFDAEWVCHVEQGHYGHPARKATWLLAVKCPGLPALNWTACEQRLPPPEVVARIGYKKASRSGVMAYVSGEGPTKAKVRSRTPAAFRDILLAIARSANMALAD